MKKLATLFTESWQEFRQVRTVTAAAMFGAVSVILGYFTIAVGDYIKIGFSSISNQFVYYLFGPAAGMLFGGALDVLKYLIKPTGAFFPGFTLGAMVGGLLYGFFFYKRPIGLFRVLAAEFTVSLVCNVLLGTLWLSMLYGKGFLALLPMRIFKNLVMWPVNSLLFYSIAKTLEASGVFRALKTPGRMRREEKKRL
ncbi:MAG: folate family ECF transporter S component [Eubacteriales bacterium]|nr:folate family ECF transporter S component [Eubacteriales bacterium]